MKTPVQQILEDLQDMNPDYYNRNYNWLHSLLELEKVQKGYSDDEAMEFFIEGYKQRAIASDLIFDNASRMYAIHLFEQFKMELK